VFDEARVRAELRAILAGPEFARAKRGPDVPLSLRVWVWLQGKIAAQPEGVRRAVVAVSVVLLVLVCLHLVVSLRVTLRTQRSVRESRSAKGAFGSSVEELARAESAAQQGNSEAALRHLYLSILLHLEENRVIVRRPGVSDRFILTQGSSVPGLQEPLARIVRQFQENRYGGHPVQAAEYAALRADAETVFRIVSTSGASRAARLGGKEATA